MKYFSLDIETTGLDENAHQIVEIGGVIDDLTNIEPIDELPEFHCYVTHEVYNVSEFVLGMHSDTGIWKRLQNRPNDYDFLTPHQATDALAHFLYENYIDEKGKNPIDGSTLSWDAARHPENYWSDFKPSCFPMSVTAAGKNFASFDLRFLKTLPNLEKYIRFHHRVLDPGPLYTRIDDDKVPNMKTCLERIGIEKEIKHWAVADAKDVVRLIRSHYGIAV